MNGVRIGSDNGLLPIRHQAIIWTNAGLLTIGPLGTNFSEILIKIKKFSFRKSCLKILSAKLWPFCPGGDELTGSTWGSFPSCHVPLYKTMSPQHMATTWNLTGVFWQYYDVMSQLGQPYFEDFCRTVWLASFLLFEEVMRERWWSAAMRWVSQKITTRGSSLI